MWKWIIGALLVLVVAVAATCYIGYQKFTSGGDAAIVTIAAPPARVFASLANGDSLTTWMAPDSRVTIGHPGMLAVGDTLHVESGAATGRSHQDFTWVVTAVTPSALLVVQMESDSTGQIFATRSDSLVAIGDSTRVISTIASPMLDSLKEVHGDSGGKMRGALLDISSKMLISGFRAWSQQDLGRLKERLDGKAPSKSPR